MSNEKSLQFSSVPESFPTLWNPLYRAREAALRKGDSIVDLISGNVNQHGINFPEEVLREIFLRALPMAKIYQPDSFGQPKARETVSQYYAAHNLSIQPDQILLTPGTSISYFYCFQLLADPGDEILCPSPSYPLFETIARLSRVQLTSYQLVESRDWEIDLDYLESQITTRTRAIVAISPHNPTGAVTSIEQWTALAAIARRHQLPIVSDEVFSEFLHGVGKLPRPAGTDAPLVFTLNGISKMYALAGMKLGWITVSGDEELVKKSLRALELISDTFLPVNEVVQFAVPSIFELGREFLRSYQEWVTACQKTVVRALSKCRSLEFVGPQGGFYLTARVKGEAVSEDQIVIAILDHCKALVHPGYFYDIPPSHLVMTFVQEPEILRRTVACLADYLDTVWLSP
jgi:alanine-synthesizing transaminase